MKHLVTAVTVTVIMAVPATAAPASAQTYLDQLLQKITRPKTAAGSSAASPQTKQAAATITPAQTATIDRLLAQPVQDPRVSADRTEAATLIKLLLATASCATASEAWNTINRVAMTPQTYRSPFYGELVPMGNLQYHDKAHCLDVARLPAKEASRTLGIRPSPPRQPAALHACARAPPW